MAEVLTPTEIDSDSVVELSSDEAPEQGRRELRNPLEGHARRVFDLRESCFPQFSMWLDAAEVRDAWLMKLPDFHGNMYS